MSTGSYRRSQRIVSLDKALKPHSQCAIPVNRSIEAQTQFQPCLSLLGALATIILLLMPVPHPHSLIFSNVHDLPTMCATLQKANAHFITCSALHTQITHKVLLFFTELVRD